MKHQSTLWLLLFLVSLLLLFSACTPTPNCDVYYTVTKEEDTDDGVCSNSDCSLREAVLNANACPGPHTITLPAGGYTLTIPGIDEDLGETGDLDITKDLTIIGTGAPSINGGIERSFHIHSGATVTFDHIWLTDGSAIFGGGLINEGVTTLSSFTCNYNNVEIPPGGMGDAMGGCIFNTGELTILGGEFLANTAGYGGAIYNYENATLTLENSDFTGNEADHLGGAIWNGLNADLMINGGEFRLNESGLHGGAIWNHGDLEGIDLYFEDNQAAGNGGGVFAWTDSFTIFTNSWFTLNTADLGGGLYNDNGMVHFYESGLTANTATGGAGGGVYNLGPAPPAGLLLKNVTVSNNTAPGGLGGAGIYNNSNFDLRFITVAGNNPEGIRIDGGAEIKIRSSALANNPGGNCAGIPPDSLDYNIENDGSCAFSEPHDLPATDPLLEPLAALGGMAPSHALGVGSPAIDTGVPDLCIAYDQNGTTRPQGPWCDRGAVENLSTKGIVRGWTYIDDNDNSIRDPGEGSVTGAQLTLKEGPCPGVSDIVTVESETGGFYEIIEIDPGDYCLATSPLQQSADPTSYDLVIAEGDVLEEINFRYMLRVPDASASGVVWHDLCAVPYTTSSTLPPGCIALPGGGLGADGIYDPVEPGIAGVEVKIGTGPCPISLILTSTPTDINGEYSFPFLFAGTYCITVDPLAPPNDSILIPGSWTYPVRDASPAETEITIAANEHLGDVNFGWDYQFLPEPTSDLGRFNKDGFCREGPNMNNLTVTAFTKGTEVEILARTEPHLPLWWWIKELQTKILCWVFAPIIDTDVDPDLVETREAPPTPTPIPCSRDLSPEQCVAAGGKMSTVSTTAPYCICP
jgi:CSLREA domain-containing protein